MSTLDEWGREVVVKKVSVVEDWHAKQREIVYQKWESWMERVLYKMVEDDITDRGLYLDDEIGDNDYIDGVSAVVEHMTRSLWDSYGDNIDDIISEEIGTDRR